MSERAASAARAAAVDHSKGVSEATRRGQFGSQVFVFAKMGKVEKREKREKKAQKKNDKKAKKKENKRSELDGKLSPRSRAAAGAEWEFDNPLDDAKNRGSGTPALPCLALPAMSPSFLFHLFLFCLSCQRAFVASVPVCVPPAEQEEGGGPTDGERAPLDTPLLRVEHAM